MAKKNKPSVGNPGDDAPEPDRRTPLQRAQEEQELSIVDLLKREDLNTGVVELKRRAVNETEFGHLAEMAAGVFSQENVRKIYGGGDYKAKVRKSDGTLAGNFSFKVDYSIPAKYPGAQKPDDDRPRENMAEVITAVTAAVKSNMPPPPPPQDNALTLELIRQQGESTKAMMQLVLANRAPAVDPNVTALTESVRRLNDEIRDMKNNANSGGGGDPFSRFMTMSAKVDEMVMRRMESMGGGDAGPVETDWKAKLLEIFGPVAAQFMMRGMNIDPNGNQQLTAEQQAAVQAALGQGQQPLLPAAAMPGGAAAPGAVTIPPAATATPPAMLNPIITAYLKKFCADSIAAAKKGRNAFDFAEFTIDAIPADYHEKIFTLANGEDWFATIYKGDASASVVFQWILDMRNGILTRWLIAETVKAYTGLPRLEPEAFGKAFVDRSSVSYHDALWDLLDGETWKNLFVGQWAGKEGDEIDAVWLEKLRVAFEHELDPDDGTETETPPAAAAAPASSPAGTGEAPKTEPPKPAAAAKAPPPKKSPRRASKA